MVLIKKLDPTTIPPKQNSGHVGRKGGFKSKIKKPANERRRPLDSESIFGEELFASNVKREKEIVVHFHPFTKNNLRISSCGKFIIEKISPKMDEVTKEFESDGYRWDLFYFKNPITDFEAPEKNEDFKEIEYYINPNNIEMRITFYNNLELLKAKIVEFVRTEFLVDRKNRLQDLRDQDIEAQRLKDARELAENVVEDTKNEVIEQVEPEPQFPVHMKVGMRTKCGRLCLAVSNVTDDLSGVTCEKCSEE